MANYQHMLKRKGQAEYAPAGAINIPLWREGDERRITVAGDRLYVRVVERIDRDRVIYTEEVDPRCLVEWPDERRSLPPCAQPFAPAAPAEIHTA
jgi:hypothetical protein